MLTHKVIMKIIAPTAIIVLLLSITGCTPSWHSAKADRVAYSVLANARQESISENDLAGREKFDIDFKPMSVADAITGDGSSSVLQRDANGVIRLGLNDCLKIALNNSLELQRRKEDLYLEALSVANTRHDWSGFSGMVEGNVTRTITGRAVGDNVSDEGSASSGISFTRKLAHGGMFTLGVGLDLASDLLNLSGSKFESNLNASFTQPLLRGAWFGFAYEDLYRQERNLLISTFEFERYTQTFFTSIIQSYYRVLQSLDTLNNEVENIARLEVALTRIRLQVEGGEATRVEQNQAERDLLDARARLMSQRTTYQNALDRFKITVGLPMASEIELDGSSLSHLNASGPARIPLLDEKGIEAIADQAAAAAAGSYDAKHGEIEDGISVQLRQSYIDRKRIAAFEHAFDQAVDKAAEQAIGIALHAQPAVLREMASLRDARRDREKAANDFLPGLELNGSFTSSSRHARKPFDIDTERGVTELGLTFDYSLDQTDNREAYRQTEILYERARREARDLVRTIRQEVRQSYRQLVESRRTYDIRKQNLALARRQQKLTAMEQAEGRASTRDVLEAEEGLRNAQNNLTSAAISYETERLDFLASLGMLDIASSGKYTMRSEPQLFDMIEKRYGGIEALLEETQGTVAVEESDSVERDISLIGEKNGNSDS